MTITLDRPTVAMSHPEALAEFCRIDGPDGPQRLDLWQLQRELIRLILRSPRVLVLKARQLGVTWALALIALWWVIAHPGQTVLVVSIGQREATDVLRRVKRLYGSLPEVIRATFPLGQDTHERLEIAHPEGAAAILSLPSSSNAGRGQTVHLLIGDERPKWPNAEEQEAALLPAAADVGRVVLVGTANGFDGFHDRFVGAPGNGWEALFVGALARPDRSPGWVERERETLGELGPQEFPLTAAEAFLSSGRCAFDRQALVDLANHAAAPALWRGYLRRDVGTFLIPVEDARGNWWVWEWPEEGREYLVAADPHGGASNGDFAAAAVYDVESQEQVAAYHGRIEPDAFAAELLKAGWLYRRALLAPESNNHGQAVVALLREWAYPRIYQSETFDQRTKNRTVRLGWTTDVRSRGQAIAALQAGVRRGTLGIRDAAAIAEMHRFVWRETPSGGRYEADEGAHDDRVLAHAIAAAVLGLSAQAAPSGGPIVQVAPVAADPVTGYGA